MIHITVSIMFGYEILQFIEILNILHLTVIVLNYLIFQIIYWGVIQIC